MRTATPIAAALLKATLALCTLFSQAQNVHYGESFGLNSTLSPGESHEYHASHYIDLTGGFHSEPQNHNYTLLELDSEGYGVYPPEVGMLDNYDCVVGALGGTVDISAMGGLVYSIPLELPSGINGMQPNLSITYNSQAGNGLLGWGWDLTGLSSITRTGQTLYHDDKMTAADLSWNDRFLLDGKRLVKVADYTDSVEYRTEQDEMSRIMAYMRYEPGGLFGLGTKVLDHFVVWKANGLIMEYGATQDSWIDPQHGGFQAVCWLLNKATDRNGNSIVYQYDESQANGTHPVDLIEYTVNEAQSVQAQFSVKFNYSNNRLDSERYYIAGNQVGMSHLLNSIVVSSKLANKNLIEYGFSYIFDYYRAYNNLTRMSMKSYDENGQMEKVRATAFERNPSYAEHLIPYAITNSGIFGDFPFTGDFNGDGYTDVAMVPYKDTTVYNTPVNVMVYLNDRNQGFEHAASMDLTLSASLDWIHVLDINGDGLDDLVPRFYDTVPSSGSESTTVLVYLNNPTTQSFIFAGNKTILSKGDVIVGDFNGDCIQDVVFLEKTYHEIPITPGIGWFEDIPLIDNAYYIGYLNHQIHTIQLNNTNLHNLGPAYNVVAADFNGDGTSEVLLVGINHNNTDYHGSKICRFDFSGNNNGCLVLQDFSTFQSSEYYPFQNIGTATPWCPIFSGDYNGDGKADIIYYHYGTWRVSFSQGESMGKPLEITASGLPTPNCSLNFYYPSLNLVRKVSHSHMATCIAADFDGDGCADLGFTYEGSHAMYFDSRIEETSSTMARFRKQFHHAPVNISFHSQFIHLGNFLGRDNVSFLCSVEPTDGDRDGSAKILSLRPAGLVNSVDAVTDGMGNRTSFTYDWLSPKPTGTPSPFYTYSYSAPDANGVRRVPLCVRALNTCTVEGVNDSKQITKYRYQNAMCHKYGHGFMGFSTSIVETYHNSTDSLWTAKKVFFNESSTMGAYAMMLPDRELSYIYSDGEARAVNRTQYTFANARLASGLTDLVVCPAMTGKTEEIYSMDEEDELIATVSTSYQYNYNESSHSYNNAYGCTETTQTVTEYDTGSPVCELQTEKRTGLQTIGSSWIVNRPVNGTVTHTRNNESKTSSTYYTYSSNSTYQPQTVTVLPNDGSLPNDPLTVLTTYEYDVFGNVTGTTLSAPYGTHGEEPRTVGYEYDGAYQHRLITSERKGAANDGYVTIFGYDFHDRLSNVTDCNGKQTAYTSSILGNDRSTFPCDGTEQRSLTLWADQSPYKPAGATYYTWSKKTGGVTAMTFYHKSGVELRSVTFDFQGNPVFTDKKYNAKGLLERESAPYRMGEPEENVKWTVYHYDAHDRMDRVDYPDGSVKTVAFNGLETTTTVTPSQGSPVMTPQATVKRTNALGWLRESVDANGTSVFYEYYADGNLKWTRIGSDEATTISMEYDHAGNRTRLHDPDYCTSTKDLVSVFNAFGEEVNRTTPRDVVTSFTYDRFGRMTERTEEYEMEPGVLDIANTSWNYSETVPTKGLLSSIVYPGQSVSYGYDTCQRVITETSQFSGGETHLTRYVYDGASRIATVSYPSDVVVEHRYNSVGYPRFQYDAQGQELYRTESTTPMGQTERFTLGGILSNTLEYDPQKQLLTRAKTQKKGSMVQNYSFTYDGFCNLASRKDDMRNLEETFTYDSQNRLTGVWLGATQTGASAYDGYGRMTAKTADGQPVFSNAVFNTTAKPHAMDAATTAAGVFPATPQTVTYTGFDKVSKVKQGNDSLCYVYGYDRQRIAMEEHVGNTVRTKRYVGNCEYVTETDGKSTTTYWLTYLTSPTGVYAVVETRNSTDEIHYILKDNLGSWTAITDENGIVEQRLSYDAWGNLRNPDTWSGSFTGTPMFDRGFTGHEHLYNLGLINMNGRMYDPVVSSFLSVDQYVQSPENAQGFNRYAYCMNNPLRYVDPSGWLAGGGYTGYTPNSSANAFDPYMFYGGRIPLEPRDLGLHPVLPSDPVATWMEENELFGGGGGGNVGISTSEQGNDVKYIFGYGDPNPIKIKGEGACLFASLGMICKRLNHWDLDPSFWKRQEELFFSEVEQHGYDSKYLEDFIRWVGEKNNIDFDFERIQILSIPDAYKDKSQVLIIMELAPENIEKNNGDKGHVAVLNTFSISSTRYQTMYSMTFGDPSPQRFLYNYKEISPYILPCEVTSWLFYKFNIVNYNKQ